MSELRLFDDDGGAVDVVAAAPAAPERVLTAEQQLAIERRNEPLMLVAGAGSGKTTVLVERIVRHVIDDEIPLSSILAITFTRKAAGELRARVRKRFHELGRRDAAREVDGAWISTIDGMCARILRAHAVVAGVDPAFRLLSDGERRELREQAFAHALDSVVAGAGRAAAADLLAGVGTDELAKGIWQVYDGLRSAGSAAPRLTIP